jgi:8-oxo-dGTP pyrophosphatase MutT (NUDIX family)
MTLPQRSSARLLILDPDGRLLLFRYEDAREPPFWATPGGQLLPGEIDPALTVPLACGYVRNMEFHEREAA